MLKAGVIGYPLSHTLSPIIHNYWLSHHNLAGQYDVIQIEPDQVQKKLLALKDQGYRGVNVTLPFKEIVKNFCTTLTKDAEIIGAVNTIIFHESGEIEGRNNDAYGFIAQAHNTIWNLDLSRVMILGAGGAARAIIYALKKAGANDIILTNRTLERAEILVDEFDIRVMEWHEKENNLSSTTLLVNTTSCGMVGQPELDIDIHNINPQSIVYDIVYKPLMTTLLKSAHAKNLRIITGLGMLLHQAAPAFESFFGKKVTVTKELEDIILGSY
jgi:shikimate dehydrogenase